MIHDAEEGEVLLMQKKKKNVVQMFLDFGVFFTFLQMSPSSLDQDQTNGQRALL